RLTPGGLHGAHAVGHPTGAMCRGEGAVHKPRPGTLEGAPDAPAPLCGPRIVRRARGPVPSLPGRSWRRVRFLGMVFGHLPASWLANGTVWSVSTSRTR